jgi:hypothetical protein
MTSVVGVVGFQEFYSRGEGKVMGGRSLRRSEDSG